MSTRSEELVLVREKIPYTGKGPDALLGMLRKVLADNPYTQEFTCRVGHPIEIAKLVPPGTVPPKLGLHDALRQARMEEFSIEEGPSGFQVLYAMFDQVAAEGLEVSHIVVGDKFTFQKWLGIRIPQNRLAVFGVPLAHMAQLPPEAFVVAGTEGKSPEFEDIRYAVKATIP